MAEGFLYPGNIVSMGKEAAQRLIALGSGDAALLFLCLLSGEGAEKLGWTRDRLEEAHGLLVQQQLADPKTAAPAPVEEKLERDEPPDYTQQDINTAMTQGSFPQLVKEMQQTLGKIFSLADCKTLLEIYDYLGFPAEVIFLLASWKVEESAQQYGPGRKPTVHQIKKEAFLWHRAGVDSLETAEDYLKRRKKQSQGARRILPLLGIHDRAPVTPERKYLESWAEMGFEDEVIALAYEKTILKKQTLNWAYLNSILKSWHQKGLHTKTAVQEGDGWKGSRGQSTAPLASTGGTAQGQQRLQQDMSRLQRLLEQSEKGEEG